MTLGERITALRNRHHMSQGDLAERLTVSRQSVSKWETGSSIPDLDKLIALSEIFGITLDELVKGPQSEPGLASAPTPEETTDSSTEDTPPSHTCDTNTEGQQHTTYASHTTAKPLEPHISHTQRIIGFLLIGAGLFGTVLGLVLTSNLMILTLLLILFGILCLTIKRHVGLVIGWIILIPAFFILPSLTGVTPLGMLHMLRHLGDAKMNLSLLLALLYWACVIIMAILTWRTVQKEKSV